MCCRFQGEYVILGRFQVDFAERLQEKKGSLYWEHGKGAGQSKAASRLPSVFRISVSRHNKPETPFSVTEGEKFK